MTEQRQNELIARFVAAFLFDISGTDWSKAELQDLANDILKKNGDGRLNKRDMDILKKALSNKD